MPRKEFTMHAPENPSIDYYSDRTAHDAEIGYPVHVYFIELAKMYMNRIRWHWHPELEIIIINHGEAELLADDQKICLKAGQGILINQNVIHSIQPANSENNCTLYSAIFHPSFLFGYGNTVMSGKYLTPILSSPVFKIMFLDESDLVGAQILDTVNSIIAVNMTKKYGYELVTKSYLCQLWGILLQNIVPQNTEKHKTGKLSMDEIRVKEAILYVEEHYAEHITLDQLAASIHTSKSECCRCFKRTLQLTPIEYLMRYRIFKAANMIYIDDPISHSISNLAFSVGFNNASYFNKVFKQYLKCTPKEYRKRINEDSIGNAFNVISI